MKIPTIWLLLLVTFYPLTLQAFYPEYAAEDALDHFNFYATYGNEGINVDKEKLHITFRHRHEHTDGTLTYKHFLVEIKEISDTLIEFHLKPERLDLADEHSNYTHYEGELEIDFEKAYETFRRGYKAPKHQTHATIRGSHIYRKDTNTKYIKDLNTNLITKVEQYTVELTPNDGLVFRVETKIPSIPFEFQYGFESVSRDQLKENIRKQIEESGLTIEEIRALSSDVEDGEKDTRLMKELLEEMVDHNKNDNSQPSSDVKESDDASGLIFRQNLKQNSEVNIMKQMLGVNTTKYQSKSKHYDWGDIFGFTSFGIGLLKGDIVRGWGILASDRNSAIRLVASDAQINFLISRFCYDWTFEAELFNTLYLRHYGFGGSEFIVATHSASDEVEVQWWNSLPFFPRASLNVVSIIVDAAIQENSREDWEQRTRYYSKVVLEIDVVSDDASNAVNDERWGIDESGELVGEDYRITINS